jgi:cullin-associated NEDD8-dissociated protein 1
LQGVITSLVASVKERVGAQDQDQEVKECAISCSSAVVAVLGDSLQDDTRQLLQV